MVENITLCFLVKSAIIVSVRLYYVTKGMNESRDWKP